MCVCGGGGGWRGVRRGRDGRASGGGGGRRDVASGWGGWGGGRERRESLGSSYRWEKDRQSSPESFFLMKAVVRHVMGLCVSAT